MSRRVILRQTGTVVVAVAVWVFCLVGAIDAVGRGATGHPARVIVVLAMIAWAGWLIFFRPKLIITDDELIMVNVLRSYRIPAGALVSWKVGGMVSMVIRLADGREHKITSWSAPGVSKSDIRPGLRARSTTVDHPESTAGHRSTDAAIEQWQARQRLRNSSGAGSSIARVTANWPHLLILAGLIAGCVAVA